MDNMIELQIKNSRDRAAAAAAASAAAVATTTNSNLDKSNIESVRSPTAESRLPAKIGKRRMTLTSQRATMGLSSSLSTEENILMNFDIPSTLRIRKIDVPVNVVDIECPMVSVTSASSAKSTSTPPVSTATTKNEVEKNVVVESKSKVATNSSNNISEPQVYGPIYKDFYVPSAYEYMLKLKEQMINNRNTCRICSARFNESRKALEHIQKHTNKCVYQCVLCSESFRYDKSFMDHLSIAHPKELMESRRRRNLK